MILKILDEYNIEHDVVVTTHAYERFILRYSLLYGNIMEKPRGVKEELLSEMFYSSIPTNNTIYRKIDLQMNRGCHYLKSDFLVFVVSKDTYTMITIKCSPEVEYLNVLSVGDVQKIKTMNTNEMKKYIENKLKNKGRK